jgi:hypothetical protein
VFDVLDILETAQEELIKMMYSAGVKLGFFSAP